MSELDDFVLVDVDGDIVEEQVISGNDVLDAPFYLTLEMRLAKGEVFDSFEEFKDLLDLYIGRIHVPYTIGYSKSAVDYNENRKKLSSKIPTKWVYKCIEYRCIHYGNNPGSKGAGVRDTR